MELKLKAFVPSEKLMINLCYGTMILIGNKVVKFIDDKSTKDFANQNLSKEIFPIKQNTYTLEFLDKYDKNISLFNATIQIKDGFKFYVKLNSIEKFQIKWMLKEYDIQSKEMKMDFYKYILGGALGVIFTIITQEVNQRYKADPETPPKAGIQKSLEHKNLKNIDK
jgi:hypothetical protein